MLKKSQKKSQKKPDFFNGVVHEVFNTVFKMNVIINWRLLKDIGEFLELETFFQLRKVERATQHLYRVTCVYDFIVQRNERDGYGYARRCTMDQLMSVVGPVRELPILKMAHSFKIPETQRPKIPYLQIATATKSLVDCSFVDCIPLETRRLSLTLCFDDDIVDTLVGLQLERLDIGWGLKLTKLDIKCKIFKCL